MAYPPLLKKCFLQVVCLILTGASVFTAVTCYGQTDTLFPGDHRINTANLKPGLRQYLVYFQNPKSTMKLGLYFWMRDVSVDTKNGRKVFTIRQHWYGNDSSSYRDIFSINSAVDFAPIYHYEKTGKGIAAYNWNAADITGADSISENTKAAFSLKFDHPNFNWNLDMETFEMLPLAEGKSFAINFYDAGLTPPEFAVYKVTGSERIGSLNNEMIDCWKLSTTGTTSTGIKYSEIYWISKTAHECLKEEDSFNGTFRYKIKMPAFAPDLIKRF